MYMCQNQEKKEPSRLLIRIPIILRAGCGFMSAITSCVITVIFSLTIYHSVLRAGLGYPNAFMILIMIGGPLISCLQFVNVSSTLAAIFSVFNSENPKPEGDTEEEKATSAVPIVAIQGAATATSVEHQLYGSTSVLMRAIAGFTCCSVICFASLLFTYVIHLGVMTGHKLPTELETLVVVGGPILTSLTFMKAETTIKQLLNIDTFKELVKKKIRNYVN